MTTPRAKNVSKLAPRFTAKVKILAQLSTVKEQLTTSEQHIIARIQKCLFRANHPNTPEVEAQAALRMSSRLMTHYNITHADVLSNQDIDEDRSEQAGQSTVSIYSFQPDRRVVQETWVRVIANAMTKFFDCKVYSTECRSSYEWSFYGIAPNTVAAAMSFEMVYNLIWNWSLGRGHAKVSYQYGVASGLRQLANQERRAEEARAKKQGEMDLQYRAEAEHAKRQKELDRLNHNQETVPSGVLHNKPDISEYHPAAETNRYGNYDDHDDGGITDCEDETDAEEFSDFEPQATFKEEEEEVIDIMADFETELKKHIDSKPVIFHHSDNDLPPTLPLSPTGLMAKDVDTYPTQPDGNGHSAKIEVEDQDLMLDSWKSHFALVVFRRQAQKIAEDFLVVKDIKLRNSKSHHYEIRDYDAYLEGTRDSEKIDVKRRRIEN